MANESIEAARRLADQMIEMCERLGDPIAGDCVRVGMDRLEKRVREERSGWPEEAPDSEAGDGLACYDQMVVKGHA
jgi:hypothetical protein